MNVSLHCICGILLYCIVVASLFSFICGVLFVVQVVRGCLVPVIACGDATQKFYQEDCSNKFQTIILVNWTSPFAPLLDKEGSDTTQLDMAMKDDVVQGELAKRNDATFV